MSAYLKKSITREMRHDNMGGMYTRPPLHLFKVEV